MTADKIITESIERYCSQNKIDLSVVVIYRIFVVAKRPSWRVIFQSVADANGYKPPNEVKGYEIWVRRQGNVVNINLSKE